MVPMRKLAYAALALSMIAPGAASAAAAGTAAAAAAATSADFKDLTAIDAGLKTKIDALLAGGVFEGVSANTFGIDQNMTRAQFAKVLDLVYGIKVDNTATTSSFSDVKASDMANGWSIPYIEAAKKAGLIDGMTDTTFAPGDPVTLGQFSTALVKGLGKHVDMSGIPWYADAMKQALQAKMLPADANGAVPATRADLVYGAYAAKTVYTDLGRPLPDGLSIASAKATDAMTIQVAVNRKVDASQATLTLYQGAAAVVPTKTSWSADGMTATLTLAGAALSSGDYTVTLSARDSTTIGVSAKFHYDGSAATSGGIGYTNNGAYVLGNVINSGLTGNATGSGGLVTKTVAEDPAQSKLAKEIVITAKTAAGETIGLPPGIIQSIASSDPSVVKVGVSGNHKGFMLGNKAGTAIVSFTYQTVGGDVKQGSVNVTVKSEPLTVDKIEAGTTSFTQPITVTGTVYYGQFNAFAAMDLTITDNYGEKYEKSDIPAYNFALGVLFTVNHIEGDAGAGNVGTVSVDGDGTVQMYGNVTGFELTAVSAGGKQATSYVTVEKR